MDLRIGPVILSPNGVFLIAGWAFFVMLSLRALQEDGSLSRGKQKGLLAVASLWGAVGGIAYGHLATWTGYGAGAGANVAVDVLLGSFGGIWGTLLGSALFLVVIRAPVAANLDHLVPGVAVGAAVARMGDLFAGCSPGITLHAPFPEWFQPFRPWPIYDILALAIAWVVCLRMRTIGPELGRSGMSLALFLVIYGTGRFGVEFARDAFAILGPLTYGQLMALAQFLAGGGVVWAIGKPRSGFS